METNGKGTFVVKIINTQNATWQGTIAWTNSNVTQPFRSALELIKLIESALQRPSASEEGE